MSSVLFMISYALNPADWRTEWFDLTTKNDPLVEAMVFAFDTHVRRAIERGLLQGYQREEESLNVLRGRIRLGDQIKR